MLFAVFATHSLFVIPEFFLERLPAGRQEVEEKISGI